MSLLKKQKTDDSPGYRVRPNRQVSTTTDVSMIELNSWLLSNNVAGLGRVEFKYSEADCGGSLGCFAKDNIQVGDNIFIIPQSCIIGISGAKNSLLSVFLRKTAIRHNLTHKITLELLIWLYMIEQRASKTGDFHVYLNSLDPQSPSPVSWSEKLLESLEGTNLGVSIVDSRKSLEKHFEFLQLIRQLEPSQAAVMIPASVFTLEALIWAKGHYLARRYPGDFSQKYTGPDLTHSPSNAGLLSVNSMEHREPGLQNLGSMVPLLDILNHNDQHDWLKLEVHNNCLYVKCNHPVEKGSELFSNYGSLSNEKLLFAYGFALPDNAHDAVAVRLRSGPQVAAAPSEEVSQDMGVFYIEAGGVTGVSVDLWSILSKLGGGRRDSESSEPEAATPPREGDEGGGEKPDDIEVGVDECVILHGFLESKLKKFDDEILSRAESVLKEFGVDLGISSDEEAADHTPTSGGLSTPPTGADGVPAGRTDSWDIRAQYVKHYLQGQYSILVETITALDELIAQAEEAEGEEGEDENEGQVVEGQVGEEEEEE